MNCKWDIGQSKGAKVTGGSDLLNFLDDFQRIRKLMIL